MATYAIGDIQGCFDPFLRLLKRIKYREGEDRLWIAGDLVNRGKQNLEMLRWAVEHDIITVLGNHDVNLLASAEGVRELKSSDTFQDVLKAKDRDPLLDWLRGRPFLVSEGKWVLAHAGLLPAWTVDDAHEYARELEGAMRSDYRKAISVLSKKEAPDWDPALKPPARWHSLGAIFSQMRTCTPEGKPVYGFNGEEKDIPKGQVAWFAVDCPRDPDVTVLFGHWSALGFKRAKGVIGLDSACVWGGSLTAIRLEDEEVFHEPCKTV